MPTAISTSVINLSEFFRDLMAFSVANAGFTDTTDGSTNSFGLEIFTLTKTVEGQAATYTFEDNDNASAVHRFPRINMSIAGVPVLSEGIFSLFATGAAFEGYWFFTEGTAVHAVLEILPGIFNHLSFGNLEKYGVYTGGSYLTSGSYTSSTFVGSVIRYSINANGGNAASYPFGGSEANTSFAGRVHVNVAGSNVIALIGREAANRVTMFSDPTTFISRTNQATLRAPLGPAYVRARNPITGLDHIIGVIPGVRSVNLELIQEGEVVNTNWRCFPVVAKRGDATQSIVTGDLGLAYEIT